MIVERQNDSLYIVYKFINRSPHSIIDIRVSLYGNIYQNTENTLTKLEKISTSKIEYVEKYSPDNKERPDAIWGGFKIEDDKYKTLNEYDDLIFEFIARESYFNTFLTFEKKYLLSDIKENYTFEMDDNLTCRQIPERVIV